MVGPGKTITLEGLIDIESRRRGRDWGVTVATTISSLAPQHLALSGLPRIVDHMISKKFDIKECFPFPSNSSGTFLPSYITFREIGPSLRHSASVKAFYRL